MSKAHPPELKKFMDKKLSLKLNGGRRGQQNNSGVVVIRGNSIIMLEALERV
ncbi:small nuclear ribonucleoprotein G-like [Rattus rattus]|uniref:small nuclear ribonucleoprotein G-like n=1 Tax=Rattus rattus TaxID=10117 RepID=UPI0013F34406|nr:small nuclear ribonucleoprotein G-like [Rattus rattus]